MATKLTKEKEIVLTGCSVRDRGKLKPIVLTIFPSGDYVMRPSGTRRGGDAEVCGSLSKDYTSKLYSKFR